MKPKAKGPLKAYEFHGVEFTVTEGVDNAVGTCPFCWKNDHFYVNVKTGQCCCKHCGFEGNKFTFLTELSNRMAKETHPKDLERLGKLRGLPAEAFRPWKVGYDGTRWLLPAWSENNTVRDVRVWAGEGALYSTDSCDVQLYGWGDLLKARPGTAVWVCEGEWDAIALRWLLSMAGRAGDVVVAVPGTDTFKDEWAAYFRGMRVILCYDNDEPGDRGSLKAGAKIRSRTKDISYLCWPDSRPLGWDIRDYVLDGRGKDVSAAYAVRMLEALVKPTHRRAKTTSSPEKAAPAASSGEKPVANERPADFKEVLGVFAKWIRMDSDFETALAIALAVCISNNVPGDPLWFYLVAPPSSGKTVILMSLQDSERCVFRSTLTPASLVSGFDRQPDPSLLPLLNGKTAVFKDGTELLSMHPDARREAYSILRGAFDGHVAKSYGNGVERDYPNLHFNILIGITPAVHGDEQAAMGERFLKFEMAEDLQDAEAKIVKAMTNIAREVAMEEELGDVCRRFMFKNVEASDIKPIPRRYIDKIVALSQVLSLLRAQVDRESYGDRDLRYRPFYEAGTRVAKQLAKLGQMLTFVYGVPLIDDRIYEVLVRVAVDSSIGYHMDLVKALVQSKQGLTRDEAARRSKMPSTSAFRRLQDLEQLGAVYRYTEASLGKPNTLWRVSERLSALWGRSIGLNGAEKKMPAGAVFLGKKAAQICYPRRAK